MDGRNVMRIKRRRTVDFGNFAGEGAGSTGRIVDWCTKAKSDMPPTTSALDAGKAAFESGFLKIFTDEIYPGARAEPRMPPPVYKAISDAVQSCQLNSQDPAQAAKAASDQIDAFLSGYKGAPIL
jgi:multiple sugar transport system substrate-binding protein